MAASKFVRPAGTQLSGPTASISRTIQRMPPSGIFVVGVLSAQGDDKLRVGPNDPSAASVEEIGMDSAANARWFQLISKRTGNVMVEARGADGTVVDYFQLAMPDPPKLNLPRAANSMEFAFDADDPSRPGDINFSSYSPINEADYVDRRLQAVGFSIYLGGCHLYCSGLTTPVMLPDSHIDFGVGTAVAISTTIYCAKLTPPTIPGDEIFFQTSSLFLPRIFGFPPCFPEWLPAPPQNARRAPVSGDFPGRDTPKVTEGQDPWTRLPPVLSLVFLRLQSSRSFSPSRVPWKEIACQLTADFN